MEKEKAAGAGGRGPEKGQGAEKNAPRFSRSETFSKPADLSVLLAGFKDQQVSAQIVRPRLQVESVEHGRGNGLVRNFTFRKFKEEPHAVVFMAVPRSTGGGIFEPTDRLLEPGEQVRVSYNMTVEGADKPVFFLAKGYFLRKSFYIHEDPQNPGKCWSGPREEAARRFSKEVITAGSEVLELRLDTVNSFPGGPGKVYRDILGRYLSDAKLFVLPGGGGWSQKSSQGNFFANIRDPLDKYLAREGVKVVTPVILDEFANAGEVTVLIKEQLLGGMDVGVVRVSMAKKPNDFLGEINVKVGFLLRFKMADEVAEQLARVLPNKAGAQNEAFLPLVLERVTDAREQYRVVFRIFPRDLVEERGRKVMDQGLKFMPPYALHPGAENHNTYSKLLIILSQRFREDEKPDEEKLKSAKLQASVSQRITERRGQFVDEKLKSAFQDRVAAKKRQEENQ